MLCAKCHKNEATVHFDTVTDGKVAETVHLCKVCAAACGLPSTAAKEPEPWSVMGKKCEFCGQAAASRVVYPGTEIYWCSDCGLEFGRVIMDLCQSERPDLIQRKNDGSPSLTLGCNPENRDWEEQLHRKTAQILKERRRQDGQDKGS